MTDKQLAIIELNRILADRNEPVLRRLRAHAVAIEAALDVLAEDDAVDASEGITPDEIRMATTRARNLRAYLDLVCKRFEKRWK